MGRPRPRLAQGGIHRVRSLGQAGLALLCRARRQTCAIPLVHIVETMRPLAVVPMVGAPPFVCGVSLIRDESTPVVDMGALLGATEASSFTRFITVRASGRQVALALEEVMSVRDIPEGAMAALPPLLRGAGASMVLGLATLDADLLFVLEGGRAVPPDFWPMFDERPQ